ncbi:MAG: hypothetical protein LBT01_01740, partial [Spirochaetaceae bacterium]|nr:hypothetical protein [Spirochaetaceae bacterium]
NKLRRNKIPSYCLGWRKNYATNAAVGEGVCFLASLPRPACPPRLKSQGTAQERELQKVLTFSRNSGKMN